MPKPKNKQEFRAEMAEQFAKVLEEKGLEWKKEWNGTVFQHRNGVTNAKYHGANAFWLSLVAMNQNFKDPRWVTMLQIQDEKGKYHPGQKWHLKAGSKATYVEYWYPFDSVEQKAVTWKDYHEALNNGRSAEEYILSVRYTPVFNASQVEGMPELATEKPNHDVSMDDLVKTLSEAMNVEILTDGKDKAYYSRTQDKIHLPSPESFKDTYSFNATALHELSHATGHPDRLNRAMSAFYGAHGYGYEELVAEIASCFMGAELQVEPTKEHLENHKAYVQGWVKAIREKPDVLIKAIRDAEQASSYMEMKAGLIPETEYNEVQDHTVEVKEQVVVPER